MYHFKGLSKIFATLLTVVGDGWKKYNMGTKLDSFLRKGYLFFSFVHVVLLISLEIMRKKYLSKFILQGRNFISNNILHVRCSLSKIK